MFTAFRIRLAAGFLHRLPDEPAASSDFRALWQPGSGRGDYLDPRGLDSTGVCDLLIPAFSTIQGRCHPFGIDDFKTGPAILPGNRIRPDSGDNRRPAGQGLRGCR